jgi:NADPH:quinone reductase-like Zn-dependent oxidoreductase
MDIAGVVDEIGDGVTTVSPGDDVMAIVIPKEGYGGYSEYLVVPQRSVVRMPKGTSYAEAATLPMNGLTARLSLDLLALALGSTLAVTGAAGTYGAYVVELAKADGLRVIADSSEQDEALVRSLGADVVVRRGPDVAQRFLEHAPGGVDGLADGSVQNEAATPAVRRGGGFATVRGWSGNENPDVTVHHVWVREYAREWEKLDRLRQLVEAGAVSLRVAGRFPAADAAEAHRLLERGGARGRFVIEF